MLSELTQLIEKAIDYAFNDAFYILPLIGSIQIFFIGFFYKKPKLIYLSIFLFLLFCFIFPFAKLIPNLGSDAFSEFQSLNLDEVYFYIKTLNFFAGWSHKHFILWLILITAYLLIIFILFLLTKRISVFNFLKINYFIIFIIILVPTSLNFYKVSLLYSSSIIDKENQSKNINYKLDTIDIKLEDPKDLSVVFYIGEATSRLHWSIYQYFRPTNNNLENFSKQNNLIIYDNIYSTHTHTSPSLLDSLTIKANTNDKFKLKITSEYPRFPIVDILNNVKINTTLFSTQAKSGSWNLSSSLIFKNAKKKNYSFKYNLGNANYINREKSYDHDFLRKFTKEIKKDTKNNFFVFHSYAGHGNYKKNIPINYRKKIDQYYSNYNNKAIFGKSFKRNQKEFLENYDSAMNYISDNIVFSLKEISKLKKPIIFIYTSDHGESPLTGRAHDSSRYIWEMSAVPFLIYFNDEAKLRYPEFFEKLNLRSSHQNRDLLNNLPSLILEIFGIKVFDANSKLNSVSKCKFGDGNCIEDYHIIRNQLNTLGAVTLSYPVKDNNDYIDNTDRATTFSNMKNYFSKKKSDVEICSHRTNSIARFIRFSAILNCMEIDLIIENDYLDVSHSKKETTSLKLVDLIKIQKNKNDILWLDVKNVQSIDQCIKLMNHLKNIHLKNNQIKLFIEFPSNIINEISNYKECISNIKLMNFPTSYYIPNNVKSKCLEEEKLNNSDEKSCKYTNEIIQKIYESSLFTDLSFDYKNYDYLKNNNQIDKFTLNTWHIPDQEIMSISDKNFRLIIPYNDDVNYN